MGYRRSTHLRFESRLASHLSNLVVTGECGDRLDNELGSGIARVVRVETLVFLEEKKNIVPCTINKANIGLGMPPFTAYEGRDSLAGTTNSVALDVARVLEQVDGEVNDRGSFRRR